MSDIFTSDEVKCVAKRIGLSNVLSWKIENASNEVIGYLGEHLKLHISGEKGAEKCTDVVFVKCMPRLDAMKAKYVTELGFFKKEFAMLSKLFAEFTGDQGIKKWRPKALLVKENVFVFEDLTLQGYKMPNHQETMNLSDISAVIISIARFHAQSIIYEDKQSKFLNRAYTIWEEYNHVLIEPSKAKSWRDSGRDAVIEYLKVYSKFKVIDNFNDKLDKISVLFDKAAELLAPSKKYTNVIVHRDLWTNNIFLNHNNKTVEALLIDYQTVVYCSPMIDLASVMYFNTSGEIRNVHTKNLINLYFDTMKEELESTGINIDEYFSRSTLEVAYKEAILFGITQAAIILPITVMDDNVRKQLFADPKLSNEINEGSRSRQIIEAAKDEKYCRRITELFDEIVERYIII